MLGFYAVNWRKGFSPKKALVAPENAFGQMIHRGYHPVMDIMGMGGLLDGKGCVATNETAGSCKPFQKLPLKPLRFSKAFSGPPIIETPP